MSIQTVNGCIVFPHGANWSSPPRQMRVWQTELSAALPGNETRQALRAVPRRSVQFLITAASQAERARLESRLDAALQTGFGAAPFHGREQALGMAAGAGDNAITLSSDASWNWQAGDYIMLIANDEVYDLAAVTSVAGETLNLASALIYSWAADSVVWPVLFGKLKADKISALTAWAAAIQMTITEVTSSRSVQIGTSPAPVPGVGEQIIGSTNTIG